MRPRGMALTHLQTTPRLLPPTLEEDPDPPHVPLLPRYPGLPSAFTDQMHETVRTREHLRYNRLKKSLEDEFATIYRTAGTPEAWVRPLSAASALMETRAVTTTRQKAHFLQEEHKRRSGHRYVVQSIDEKEATKMTQWTIEQVPGSGLPLDRLEALLDHAVALARNGGFTPRGDMSEVPGVPMVLPEGFRRRGWQTHWLDPRYPLLDVSDDLMVVRLV